jgi:hypothetical protein
MLRKILGAMVVFAGISASGIATAEGYFGISYSRVDLDGAEPSSLDIKLGSQLNDVVGVELRVGVPLVEDTVDFFGFDIDIDAEYVGALARFGSFTDNGSFYVMGGLYDVTVKASAGGASEDVSDNGPVLGVGAQFGGDSGFSLEYLVGTSDLEDISWLNLGYTGRF